MGHLPGTAWFHVALSNATGCPAIHAGKPRSTLITSSTSKTVAFLIALFFALLAFSAAPALGATTKIGAVEEIAAAAAPADEAAGGFVVQVGEASGSYEVPPGYSTITNWSHSAGTASGSLTFKVYRPTGNLREFATVAADTRDIVAGSVQTFGVRIAVLPGDRLGLSSENVQLAYATFAMADQVGFFSFELPIGGVRNTDGTPFEEFKLDVAATLNSAEVAQLPPLPSRPAPSKPASSGANSLPAPLLTALRVAPSAFAAARSGPSVRPAGRRTPATLVSFRVSATSSVRFTVRRVRPGRRRGSGASARCVAQTSANKRSRRCTREVPVPGSFTRSVNAGANRLRFSGRIGGRRLTRGSYRLVATPRANGVSGTRVSRGFRITK